MAATANSAVVNRSWAQIVKGSDTTASEPETKCALQPAARGERRCLCQGEILVMLGHYGWIMSFDEIDHPAAGKTGGRIYVHKRDVVGGASLRQGDRVSFHLYSDDQGLGAEAVELEQSELLGLNAEACEFVPVLECPAAQTWHASAHEFVPTAPSGFNAQAVEFVPAVCSPMNVDVNEFVPAALCSNLTAQNMFAINLAFFSDDESDEESSVVSNDDFSGIDGDRESDNTSDGESIGSPRAHSCPQSKGVALTPIAKAELLLRPWKLQDEEGDESTSAGSASGSEEEPEASARPWGSLATRLAKRFSARLAGPPGVTLIPGFRPPPGLTLPGVEA